MYTRKQERRQNFEINHAHLIDEAQAKLAEFNKKNPVVIEENLIEQKNDLEARVDQLKKLLENYEDPGILLDCVVFNDGQVWRAVIDVKESGDLRGNKKKIFIYNSLFFFFF